jgi:hypothetical protein
MPRAEIPAAVLQFIAKRIDSVPELETLLIMSEGPTRSWTLDDIVARTYVSPESALGVLKALQRRGLVSCDESGGFRFDPPSDEVRDLVTQTGIAYQAHLVPIATFIHQKASVPVQEFARAFSLKKDD